MSGFEIFESAAPAIVPQIMFTVQQKNFNYCAFVIEIYFMFMILCLCSKSIRTLASTVAAIVQYCLSNQENPHISVHHWTCKRLHPDSIRDSIRIWIAACNSIRYSIRTKISNSQVPSCYNGVGCCCNNFLCCYWENTHNFWTTLCSEKITPFALLNSL